MQQLDLFRDTSIPAEPCPSDEVARPVIAVEGIEEDDLLAAFPMQASRTASPSPPSRGGGA